MEMSRRVDPEWLDELPAEDPRALRSRRDIARINLIMANAGVVAGELRGRISGAGVRLAEIGAGDGVFALRVARSLPRFEKAQLTLLDRQQGIAPDLLGEFARLGWQASPVQADVFQWLRAAGTPRFDAIVANLFLHHFEREKLRELLALVAARASLFVACEPRRSRVAMLGSRLLGLAGCNDVTRHDAVVSVRAGFDGRELGDLWPDARGWRLEERARGLFSHSFVAVRG